jgi:uncharacterized lipoprotein YehR (DUF1307 family)
MKKFLALLLAAVTCLSLAACNNEKPSDDSTESTNNTDIVKLGEVKITADNFDTYFEFVEEAFFTKDGKGETNALRHRHYYQLKEDYNIDLTKSSIKLDYSYSYSTRKVQIDFENEKFTLGDQIGEKNTIDSCTIGKISNRTYKDFAIFLLQPDHASIGATELMYFSDFKLNSVEGTIYLIEPNPEKEHTH